MYFIPQLLEQLSVHSSSMHFQVKQNWSLSSDSICTIIVGLAGYKTTHWAAVTCHNTWLLPPPTITGSSQLLWRLVPALMVAVVTLSSSVTQFYWLKRVCSSSCPHTCFTTMITAVQHGYNYQSFQSYLVVIRGNFL